jgi:hypothetical protein
MCYRNAPQGIKPGRKATEKGTPPNGKVQAQKTTITQKSEEKGNYKFKKFIRCNGTPEATSFVS